MDSVQLNKITESLFEDKLYLSLLLSLIVVLVTIVLWTCCTGRHHAANILFTGLCESGKTLMCTQLCHNRHLETYTSMKENFFSYCAEKKNKIVQLVDVPGNERLRMQVFEKYKITSRGIVFVIDSQKFQQELKDVAEYLYGILTDRHIAKSKFPVLIACNKQDEEESVKGKLYIEKQLERELSLLKKTQTHALSETTGDEAKHRMPLGKEGKNFTFASLSRNKVEFIECCTKNNGDVVNLREVRGWLNSVA